MSLEKYANFNQFIKREQLKAEEESKELTLMKAYCLTGEAKLNGINEFMDTLIENNCKFIIFAHH